VFVSLPKNTDKVSRVEKKSMKKSRRITIDVQLQQLANCMHILYFRGIFMRTILLIERVCQNESSIVNLDRSRDLVRIG